MTIHPDYTALLELTKALIRIPSTQSRPEQIAHCATFIEQWLAANGIAYTRYDQGSAPSIVVLPQKGYAPLLLMTHFDVVEADDPALFEPYQTETSLFGRGAIDDKYGVAISLLLFRKHLQRARAAGKDQDQLCFGLLLTGDEEVGGARGAKLAAQSITTDFFLAIDGGNPGLIVTKEKGILSLELTASGTAAHAARPWLGTSAFDILIDDYQKIRALFQEEAEDHWHKTLVLTRCHAGNGSVNTIPAQATATLDIRYTEQDDSKALLSSISETISSELRVRALEPVFTSGPSPYLDLLVEQSGGAAIGFEHGASDARYFSSRNIPGAIWGAEGEMSQHTKNEHIVISSLYQLYERLDNYLSQASLR